MTITRSKQRTAASNHIPLHKMLSCLVSAREKGVNKEKRKKKQGYDSSRSNPIYIDDDDRVDGPFVINRNVYRSSPSLSDRRWT
uniref:Uncharacterized protein n=1 Tax=Trichogramma kaykai TaxID=54128 RepID=A0ABD2X2Y3_9HYME